MNPANTNKPKRWKMMLITWLFVYPVINIIFITLIPFIKGLPPYIMTLIITLILVPLMGISIPLLHKKFWNWIVR